MAFAQHYQLRAHAVIKWDTAGRLVDLAGELSRLERDIEFAGELTPETREAFEERFSILRRERQVILKDDRDRISAATPETMEEQALQSMGVDTDPKNTTQPAVA